MSARPPGERAQRWCTAACSAGARSCARRNGGPAAVGPRRGPGAQRVDPSGHGVVVRPCRTRHWSSRAWSRQPPQPALTDLKESRSAGRSTVRDAGAPSCNPSRAPRISPGLSAHRLFGRFVPASCPGLADPGRRPAFPVPACSWRAECPDLDGQCRNGHRADARADNGGSVRVAPDEG